jgi:hypothetical protein
MWQIRAALIAMAGILFVLVPGVRADSLQLKNGNFVQGKYLGGTERAVQFAVNGKIHLYGTDEILSISFAAASADGGIPSNNVDPKPSANTELNSAAKVNCGSRVALWNQTKAPKAPARQATWEQKQYRGGSSPRVGRPAGPLRSSCAIVAANSELETRVSAIPTRSVCILPRRLSLLSD